jgi:phosphate transport system ATP-binding protein
MSVADPTESASAAVDAVAADAASAALADGMAGRIEVSNLTASYRGRPAVTGVSIVMEPRKVTALIGPSGCGKSTVLRCMNGLHMTVPGASVTGDVLLDDVDIYGRDVDLVRVRRLVGMVFQRPNPFPTMSIAQNVVAGLRLGPRRERRAVRQDEVVERSLRQAGLWNEVKDRLDKPGSSLSGGQQQRLCIARSLAIQPQVLLMDEPCSALDPVSTLIIEGLIEELKKSYTVVIVTHNMQQAARVSDVTAFMTVSGAGEPGQLVEVASTKELFSQPAEKATIDYITGKVG